MFPTPHYYQTIMLALSQLSYMFLSQKIRSMNDQKCKVSRLKAKKVLEGITQPRTTSLHLGSLQRNVVIISLTYFLDLWILEKLLIQCLEITCGIGQRSLRPPFELRVVVITLYETAIAKFKNNEGWTTYINCNIEVKQGYPFWNLH